MVGPSKLLRLFRLFVAYTDKVHITERRRPSDDDLTMVPMTGHENVVEFDFSTPGAVGLPEQWWASATSADSRLKAFRLFSLATFA